MSKQKCHQQQGFNTKAKPYAGVFRENGADEHI
jgi:hypothetical protein